MKKLGFNVETAFPFHGDAVNQLGGSGLYKVEYFALHLMAATVTANDHANPGWMNEETAQKHAKAAILLAKALVKELEDESAN